MLRLCSLHVIDMLFQPLMNWKQGDTLLSTMWSLCQSACILCEQLCACRQSAVQNNGNPRGFLKHLALSVTSTVDAISNISSIRLYFWVEHRALIHERPFCVDTPDINLKHDPRSDPFASKCFLRAWFEQKPLAKSIQINHKNKLLNM